MMLGGRLTFKRKRRVRADEHRARASAARRASAALSVDRDVSAHDERVAAVPRGGLDPVHGVEERGGGAVARVLGVDALDVGVAGGGEEIHEERLARFREVDGGLGPDVDAADGLGVDVVLFEQVRDGCEGAERTVSMMTPRRWAKRGYAPVRRKELMSSRSSQHAMNF